MKCPKCEAINASLLDSFTGLEEPLKTVILVREGYVENTHLKMFTFNTKHYYMCIGCGEVYDEQLIPTNLNISYERRK